MEIVCEDIESNKYKQENDVFKTTKMGNVPEIKKRILLNKKIYNNYNKIIHNGEFQTSVLNNALDNLFEVTSTNVKKLKSLKKDHMPQETERTL